MPTTQFMILAFAMIVATPFVIAVSAVWRRQVATALAASGLVYIAIAATLYTARAVAWSMYNVDQASTTIGFEDDAPAGASRADWPAYVPDYVFIALMTLGLGFIALALAIYIVRSLLAVAATGAFETLQERLEIRRQLRKVRRTAAGETPHDASASLK